MHALSLTQRRRRRGSRAGWRGVVVLACAGQVAAACGLTEASSVQTTDAAPEIDGPSTSDGGEVVGDSVDAAVADTFTIEILGSELALTSFELSAAGLAIGSVSTRLVSSLPWAAQEGAVYQLVSSRRSEPLDSKTARPYLCPLVPDFNAKLKAGWTFQEFHQVYLRDDGGLETSTDPEQPLRFWCNTIPPGAAGNFGSGIATVSDTPPLCSDDDRKNTAVVLSGTVRGVPVNIVPDTCLVVLQSAGIGVLELQLDFPNADKPISAVLKHCLGQDETYPESLMAPVSDCSFSGALGWLDLPTGRAHLDATEGSWVIEEANLEERAGRVRGSVNLVFTDSSSHVTMSGTFDLPVLRL